MHLPATGENRERRHDSRRPVAGRTALRGRGEGGNMGLELRRIHVFAVPDERGGRVLDSHRRGPRDELALLRLDLHGAFHAAAAGQSGRIRQQRPHPLGRRAAGQPAAVPRNGGRQRARAEHLRAGGGAGAGEQAVRHANLHEPQPQHFRREDAAATVHEVREISERASEMNLEVGLLVLLL